MLGRILPEGLRDTVDVLLFRDECWAVNRDRVEAFLERAVELERARNALTQMDVMTSYFRGTYAGPARLPAEGVGGSRRSGGAQEGHAETRARRPPGRRRCRPGRGP